MKQLLFFIFLLFSSVLVAQANEDHLIIPSGFTLESLSGYGYSKTIDHQSNAASMNPAALDRFTSLAFGISYQFQSDVKPGWIAGIGSTRYHQAIPQSVGLILPYKNLRVGFGFSQKYNSSLLYGDIPVTTTENPDPTGEYVDVSEKSDVERYSGLVSYSIDNFIYKDARFSFGVAVNYNRLNYYYRFGQKNYEPDRVLKSHGNKVTYSLGVTYSVLKSSLFSLLFEKGAEFDKMTTDENKFTILYTLVPLPSWEGMDKSVSKEPDKIHIGFDHSFSEESQITTTLSYIGWKATGQNRKDQVEAAASFIYSMRHDLLTSLGLYYTDLNYNNNAFFAKDNLFRSLYITAGAIYSFSLFDVDLTVADSHLLAQECRKETLGRISVGFHL
ncbi:MAG: hypothetical protein HF314_04180 [Ignavibacteria bacterium]|jgi:hypothetical protein|nr:hypothetical protein [Ignavibacteria bacterium]MCU7502248.1 hypothetical protein [Ignavibacteria bacterium]MCU7516708.1 hypothetical protein [Ignavibacteria bacterium]